MFCTVLESRHSLEAAAFELVAAQAAKVRGAAGGLQQGRTLLDEIVQWQGREPAWVLQPEVQPWLLQHAGDRKFHIRAYVCVRWGQPPPG